VWQSVGNTPCTFKLTNRWKWMAGFTNRALQAKEKIFQTLLDLTVCHWWVIPTLRRILSLSPSMVISPWTKSLTCGWNGTQILWLPSWQPSHYAGWEVKTSHYVLFFNAQFHRLEAALLHLLVSSGQAHATSWFYLPLQQKLGLHEIPFPWHDSPSGHT